MAGGVTEVNKIEIWLGGPRQEAERQHKGGDVGVSTKPKKAVSGEP